MGKSKNKRFKVKKPRPTGLPSVKEMESLLEEDTSPGPLGEGDIQQTSTSLSLIEKLRSPSREDRACGCASIANLVLETSALEVLLQQGIVKILGPLLMDKSDIIREGATGSLRNMSVAGGHEVCDRMIRDDVMTPLVALLKQYAEDLPVSIETASDHKVDPSTSIMEQALHLLWNLCESSNVAVGIFNEQDMLPLVIHCFKTDSVNMGLATTAAQCLHTITEDNPMMSQALGTPDMLGIMEKVLMNQGDSHQHTLLRTLTAGILCNIKSCLPVGSQAQTLQALVKVLYQTLDVDVTNEVKTFLQSQPEQNGVNGVTYDEKNIAVEMESPKIEMLENLKDLLLSQQIALEIISNLMCFEDEGEDWEEMDCNSSSSDDEVDIMEEPEIMSPLCLSAEIHNALVAQNLPVKVLSKLTFPEKHVLESLENNSKFKCLSLSLLRLQCRGLICLQNLITAVELDVLGGPPALCVVWERLLVLALTDQVPSDGEFLEALTSALRAVIQKMAAIKQAPQGLTQHHVARLYKLGKNSPCEGVRVNILGMLGSIGNVLAFNESAEQTIAAVGVQLLDIATKDPSVWVIAEALDAIFDTFGDGKTADVVADRINLVPKLKNMVPQLKSKLRQDRSKLGDRLPVVQNAKTNLIRFIKYKETQQ